jgi:hypothetical protein
LPMTLRLGLTVLACVSMARPVAIDIVLDFGRPRRGDAEPGIALGSDSILQLRILIALVKYFRYSFQ